MKRRGLVKGFFQRRAAFFTDIDGAFTTLGGGAGPGDTLIVFGEDVVGNRVVADGLNRAVQQVASGEGLTDAFNNLGLFPPLVIRMLRVGESTGALDTALANVTYFYNRDVKDAVDKGMKMLGPALTLVLGGMIAFVIWAVLGPVYDILGKMKF